MIYKENIIEDNESFNEFKYKTDQNYKTKWDDLNLIKSIEHFKYNKDKYYIPCYNVIEDLIYFNEFFTGEIIKTNKLLSHQKKEYKNRLNILRKYWNKIENISSFNQKDSYISKRAKKYFSRTINSKFLFNETKGLFNNNSSIPCIFLNNYKNIQILVTVHNSIFNFTENENIENDNNNIIIIDNERIKNDKNENKHILKDFKYEKEIPFLYVVDTIINETLNELINFLNLKKDNYLSSSNSDNKNNNENIYNNMLHIIEESLLINSNDKFILKLQSYDEYFFGDYSLGSYESIRKYIREYEKVNLILFKKKEFEINPPINNFPPIIFIPSNNNYTYYDLLDKYFENYPNNSIIFRFGENTLKQSEQYLK